MLEADPALTRLTPSGPAAAPVAWLVGTTHTREMAGALAVLRESWTVAESLDLHAAWDRCQRDSSLPDPELVVLLCDRPGRFAHADVQRLQRRVPLARWLAVLGSWCEGETRTGHPPAGVHRVYWHQLAAQARAVAAARRQNLPILWHAPPTASLSDYWLYESQPGGGNEPITVGVVCDRRLEFDTLSAVVESVGHRALWHPAADGPPPATRLIWDCGPWDARARATWQQLQTYLIDCGVALLDFPRLPEVNELQAGGWQVLGRPYRVADLLALLSTPTTGRSCPTG